MMLRTLSLCLCFAV